MKTGRSKTVICLGFLLGWAAGGFAETGVVVRVGDLGRVIKLDRGERLVVDTALKDTPLYINSNGVSSADLVRSVAKVLSASVERRNGTWTITRSPDDRARLQKLDRSIQLERIQTDQALAEQGSKGLKSLDAVIARYRSVLHNVSTYVRAASAGDHTKAIPDVPAQSFTPVGRFLRKLLVKIGAQRLADVRHDARDHHRTRSGQSGGSACSISMAVLRRAK